VGQGDYETLLPELIGSTPQYKKNWVGEKHHEQQNPHPYNNDIIKLQNYLITPTTIPPPILRRDMPQHPPHHKDYHKGLNNLVVLIFHKYHP
jgi:hypothetical protein